MKRVILCTLFGYMCLASACRTPTDLDGECIRIDECEKLKQLIKEDREYLKKWHCGYDEMVPKVCCPTKATTDTDKCDTFSGQEGSCVPVNSCPSLRKRLTKPVSSENLDYVQRSRCNAGKDMYVCCDKSELASRDGTDLAAGTCDPAARLPDRANKCCGIDSSTSNKIIGGVATAIDAYPWLAIIEYSRSRPLLCGGSLISGRYVLTAAHCLVSPNKKSLEAESVRLGEYNVTNPGADCVETDGGGTDCTKGHITIAIEKTIVHPEYNSDKKLYNVNDIALIRLAELVAFNEFIKPICLPTSDVTASPPANLTFLIAGWGNIDEKRTSEIKLEATVPFFEKETCNQRYSKSDRVVLGPGQMCAGGEDKDSCKGDSGGPLSYFQEDQPQEIVGVISFGLQQCGVKDSPSIYTKVYEYLSWIESNVVS